MRRISHISLTICILFSGAFFLTSCSGHKATSRIILTVTEDLPVTTDFSTGDGWRYVARTRLVAIDSNASQGEGRELTSGFFSALSPDVSPDGLSVVFAGRQKENDPWQIWQMKLADAKPGKVIDLPDNCTDPVFLPNGNIAFSRSMKNDSLNAGHALFTCKPDGSELTRITFQPGADFAATMLNDGRLLAVSRQLAPAEAEPMLYVIRPDGTKGDLYYRGDPGARYPAKARESAEGMVYFIESENDTAAGRLICINQNRPLHSKKIISEGLSGDFRSVFPLPTGTLLVTYRKNASEHYALYTWNQQTGLSEKPLYEAGKMHIIDAVAAVAHPRARKLPSEVDTGVKTGLLLCQDVNYLDMATMLSGKPVPKAPKIEILGPKGSLGIVDVEEDGSFYLKVMANTPIRIQTLDANGKVLNGPCAPIWLRPNERRGCVGCHEDHEMAPENRLPLAVKKAPVSLPVHIENIKEKEVELE
jgi:hypothetical protein